MVGEKWNVSVWIVCMVDSANANCSAACSVLPCKTCRHVCNCDLSLVIINEHFSELFDTRLFLMILLLTENCSRLYCHVVGTTTLWDLFSTTLHMIMTNFCHWLSFYRWPRWEAYNASVDLLAKFKGGKIKSGVGNGMDETGMEK